jgi:catechol 2,3-dioxygenase
MTQATRPSAGPRINHLVIAVRDIEKSHDFYTRLLGYERCGILDLTNVRQPMYFYRSDENDHHQLALLEVLHPEEATPVEEWQGLLPRNSVGLNHLAIAYPDVESWQSQLRHLKANDVEFKIRGNHGMTHSAYIVDPDGNGIEIVYEVPREKWEGDVNAALNYFEYLPPDGEETFVDAPSPTF